MSLEKLKLFRIIIPGILILLIGLPLFQDGLEPQKLVSSLTPYEGIVYTLVVSVLGGIYHLLGIRSLFWECSMQRIQANIKGQLLIAFTDNERIAASSENLRRGKTLINVFYSFIDSDPSLKERAKLVYLNGLFLSTLADIGAISTVSLAVYLGSYFLFGKPHYIVVVAGLFVLLIASRFFIKRMTNRHIELGNNQIEYILVNHRGSLQNKLLELADRKSIQ